MDVAAENTGLAPFSLRDAPALIERVFPAQKVGAEAQKERKAGAGQTLTALGSYWKGRKPLVLVRATVLACLLPATEDLEGDLELFEMVMRMDPDGLLRRKPKVTAAHVWASPAISKAEKVEHIEPPTEESEPSEELEAEDGETQEGAAEQRKGTARWTPIDLSEFDDEEASAKETGKLNVAKARNTSGTKAARDAAVAAARAEANRAVAEVKRVRDAERDRILRIRRDMMRRTFFALPFSQQVTICERVEKTEDLGKSDDPLYLDIWDVVNARLGTTARTLPELIHQLGLARFGEKPAVGDPFSGGGSIPYAAARMGCVARSSDLNPVAAMLTWGALNVVGASVEQATANTAEYRAAADDIEEEMARLGVERNADGERAKAFLYCSEVVDPQTGWLVPIASSWVLSKSRRCIGRLVPNYREKRFDIVIEYGASAMQMALAAKGTLHEGELVYRLALTPDATEREWRYPIGRLRGDGEGDPYSDGSRGNLLRRWGISDFVPRGRIWDAAATASNPNAGPGAWTCGDVFTERLYCIQWMNADDLLEGRHRPRTRFAAPTDSDLERERQVEEIVRANLERWQVDGLVPDLPIELGEKTTELVRTRGWTHWHHCFCPRNILLLALLARHRTPAVMNYLAAALDYNCRGVGWDYYSHTVFHYFANQALNTMFSFACRGSSVMAEALRYEMPNFPISGHASVSVCEAVRVDYHSHLWVYDPPYADAVHYHEITEFFIAWLRKNSPPPFNEWTWDSRRPLAIQGKGEKFRADMVAAFRAMGAHMPDNGMQVCMFTHKDAKVWADMAQIVWAAGLQTTAAWYVSTETTSELKQGGYVQGTVLMVLRKRKADEQGFRSDIVPEVRARVADQVETLTGLNQKARGRGRDENVFSDADIQMAGYAAALEVLTGYTHIDGVDMTREALRPRATTRNAEPGIVEEMIALAVQTANELMVPEGITEGMWERLSSTERFYLKMTGTEATWPVGQPGGKLDDYQNFARVYRADAWEDLMAERSPDKARLKGAAAFKRTMMTGHAFSTGAVRPTLYAIAEQCRATAQEEDPKVSGDRVLHGLRDHFGLESWGQVRENVRLLAVWFGRIWERQRPEEAAAARVIAGLIVSERLGG